MWVANRPSLPLKLFSYDMETRQPADPSLDYPTAVMTAAGNTSPHGIWSDGSTMWVADSGKNKIYLLPLANAVRPGHPHGRE